MITTCLPGSTVELISDFFKGPMGACCLPPLGSRAKVISNRDGKYLVVKWLDGGRTQWLNRRRFKEVVPAPEPYSKRCIPDWLVAPDRKS